MENLKKKILKLLLALSLFICLVISGGWLAFHRTPNETKMVSQKRPAPLQQDTPLFYRTIGEKIDGNLKGISTKSVSAPNVGSKFTIEVLVTTQRDRATDIVKELKTMGVDAFYSAFNQKGTVFYKVRSGLFSTEMEANLHLKKISTKKYSGLKVRKL